jgi:hypothetical protein
MALTPEVVEDAKKWWGGDDVPISVFTAKPECYEPKIESIVDTVNKQFGEALDNLAKGEE